MMPSPGLLVLLISFMAHIQGKHLLIETEDNSEPMPKEEVEALLSVLPKEAKETYNNLNKTAKKAFQSEIKTIYGDDTRVVREAPFKLAPPSLKSKAGGQC